MLKKNLLILTLITTLFSTFPAYCLEPSGPKPAEELPSSVDLPLLQASAQFTCEMDTIITKQLKAFYKKGGSGTIGVYIKELKSGFEYTYNAEKNNPDNPCEGYFNTASTCKLLAAAVMYYLNKNGELELDTIYYDAVTKSSYNFKKLIPRMLSHSVNDYFNIILRYLGPEQINEVLKELGVKLSIVYSEIMPAENSSITSNIKRYGISRSPRTTPKDLGYVLELLYNVSTFGTENSKIFTQALKNNIYTNRLPAGIGYISEVAHKTGTSAGEGVYNDAGIVYLKDNPYIIVVMSKKSGSSVQNLFRRISGEVYKEMKRRTEYHYSVPQ